MSHICLRIGQTPTQKRMWVMWFDIGLIHTIAIIHYWKNNHLGLWSLMSSYNNLLNFVWEFEEEGRGKFWKKEEEEEEGKNDLVI